VIPDDEIRFINYSTDAVKYHWNFGDGTYSELFEPHHKYSKYGNFDVTLTVYNEFGCPHSMLIQNAFSGLKYFLEFPNAFIPNPDGSSGGVYSSKSDESAQVFHPSYSGVSEYQLKIFSKIGILIFESNDINIGWDGYFNGQLSNSGVYIWKVRGKYRNGEPFTKMGDVTLLKN
jgi:PKD repeat protein